MKRFTIYFTKNIKDMYHLGKLSLTLHQNRALKQHGATIYNNKV